MSLGFSCTSSDSRFTIFPKSTGIECCFPLVSLRIITASPFFAVAVVPPASANIFNVESCARSLLATNPPGLATAPKAYTIPAWGMVTTSPACRGMLFCVSPRSTISERLTVMMVGGGMASEALIGGGMVALVLLAATSCGVTEVVSALVGVFPAEPTLVAAGRVAGGPVDGAAAGGPDGSAAATASSGPISGGSAAASALLSVD